MMDKKNPAHTIKFNYSKLYDDLIKTFLFTDTLKDKMIEIGIKYSDFKKLKAGNPVSLEAVLAILVHMNLEFDKFLTQ